MTDEQLDECISLAKAGNLISGAQLVEALEELKTLRALRKSDLPLVIEAIDEEIAKRNVTK